MVCESKTLLLRISPDREIHSINGEVVCMDKNPSNEEDLWDLASTCDGDSSSACGVELSIENRCTVWIFRQSRNSLRLKLVFLFIYHIILRYSVCTAVLSQIMGISSPMETKHAFSDKFDFVFWPQVMCFSSLCRDGLGDTPITDEVFSEFDHSSQREFGLANIHGVHGRSKLALSIDPLGQGRVAFREEL